MANWATYLAKIVFSLYFFEVFDMSKPQTSINNKYDRLIALIDMDCKFIPFVVVYIQCVVHIVYELNMKFY